MHWVVGVRLVPHSQGPAAGGGLACTSKGRRLMLHHGDKLKGCWHSEPYLGHV